MEIRDRSANDPTATPERIDLTRKNREAIQRQQPLTPKADKLDATRDPSVQAKAVLAAREQHRAQHQERIANARLDYTANRAAEHAADVARAREVYEARVAKAIALRTQRAAAQPQATGAGDKLELSTASQRLARLDFESSAASNARSRFIADLKRLYGRGALNTPSLIARTASRLLHAN